MATFNKPISIIDVMISAISSIKKAKRPYISIAITMIFVPQLILNIYFSFESSKRLLFLDKIPFSGFFVSSYKEFTLYALHFGGFWLIQGFLLTLAYLALAEITFASLNNRNITLSQAVTAHISSAIKLLFLSLFAMFFFYLIFQVIYMLGFFVAALASIGPAVLVIEKKGALRSFLSAVLLKYVPKAPGAKLNSAISIIVLGGLFFVLLILIFLISQKVQNLDFFLNLSRTFWSEKFTIFPFSRGFLVSLVTETALQSAAITLMPAATISMYMTIKKNFELPAEEGPTSSEP